MENIKERMMSALCSVFWYEGLLEHKEDEDYSGFLPTFINDLKNNKNTEREYMYTCEDLENLLKSNEGKFEDNFEWDKRHTVIWQMLVEMFGECGTSPRTGWIEKREECAEFLEEIIKIWHSGAY